MKIKSKTSLRFVSRSHLTRLVFIYETEFSAYLETVAKEGGSLPAQSYAQE
jgi:hypothetical protein